MVLTLIALVIAVLFLPSPWNVLLVLAAALVDIAETGAFVWWSRRRRRLVPPSVGVETLVGRRGTALDRIDPTRVGHVSVDGEIWNARSSEPIDRGSAVVVSRVDRLLLDVVPAQSESSAR